MDAVQSWPALDGLPSEIHCRIISSLGWHDRQSLRLTTKDLCDAVAKSDLLFEYGGLLKITGNCRMITFNLDGEDLVVQYPQFRKFLNLRRVMFRKTKFDYGVVCKLTRPCDSVIACIDSFLEDCEFDSITYKIEMTSESDLNDNYRSFIEDYMSKKIKLETKFHFDRKLIWSFPAPIQWKSVSDGAHYLLAPKLIDAELLELASRGHCMDMVPVELQSTATILNLLTIVSASARAQTIKVKLPRAFCIEFLLSIGIVKNSVGAVKNNGFKTLPNVDKQIRNIRESEESFSVHYLDAVFIMYHNSYVGFFEIPLPDNFSKVVVRKKLTPCYATDPRNRGNR